MEKMPEKNRTVAVCCERGLVAPYFARCGSILLISMEGSSVTDQRLLELGGSISERADFIARQGATLLVCGSITPPEAEALHAQGLQEITGLLGPAELVVYALMANAAPGCGSDGTVGSPAGIPARPARKLTYGGKN